MRRTWLPAALAGLVVVGLARAPSARAGEPHTWIFRRSYWSHAPSAVPGAGARPRWWTVRTLPVRCPYAYGSVVYGYRHLRDSVHVGSAHDTVSHRERYVRFGPIW